MVKSTVDTSTEKASVDIDGMTVDQKINLELDKTQYKSIKIGFFMNTLSGLLLIWVFYSKVPHLILFAWFTVLVLINICNVLWLKVYENKDISPERFIFVRKISRYIFILLCITWGSIGILFNPSDLHYQTYVLAFTLAVVIAFTFGSITDFRAAVISLLCILFPTIIFRFFKGINSIITTGHDSELNLALSIALMILSSFLLIGCYIGYKWIHRFFRLTFENMALSKKLENMNKFLEQRVKERTIELEKSLKLVTYQATHDLLTDLPNQRLMLEYLDASVKKATQNNYFGVVAFFTINEIEKINDGLGYQAGDMVIKTVGRRFKNAFGNRQLNHDQKPTFTVTLSRKDVFVILINPLFNLEEVESKTEELFTILNEPVQTEKQVIKLTASIGISVFPRDGVEVSQLLMNADAAMLRAKQHGGNNIDVYNKTINADISRQLKIESDLHTALGKSEFRVQYQPFINLKTGEIYGAEVLVRWDHPTLGLISPMNFIPLAEANGIILPLGEWVLRTACEQTRSWHDLGFKHLKIAVNLSAKQLQQKNILKTVATILKETKLDPEFIELELTESEAFQEEVLPLLMQFKEMGLGLSIDDFGTGYSGLTNLKLFSIDKLKIDKSFVQDVVTNNDSKVIVSNTISLAKKMNIKVVAEGVETKEQLNFLREQNCDLIQGYYFSPPLNPEVFSDLLKSNTQFVT